MDLKFTILRLSFWLLTWQKNQRAWEELTEAGTTIHLKSK